jgi:hypothetical protein
MLVYRTGANSDAAHEGVETRDNNKTTCDNYMQRSSVVTMNIIMQLGHVTFHYIQNKWHSYVACNNIQCN